jgi:hypothetical protein
MHERKRQRRSYETIQDYNRGGAGSRARRSCRTGFCRGDIHYAGKSDPSGGGRPPLGQAQDQLAQVGRHLIEAERRSFYNPDADTNFRATHGPPSFAVH